MHEHACMIHTLSIFTKTIISEITQKVFSLILRYLKLCLYGKVLNSDLKKRLKIKQLQDLDIGNQ